MYTIRLFLFNCLPNIQLQFANLEILATFKNVHQSFSSKSVNLMIICEKFLNKLLRIQESS